MKIKDYETKFNFGDVVYLRRKVDSFNGWNTEEDLEEFLNDEGERFTINTVCLEFSKNGLEETYTFIHRGQSIYGQEDVEWLMSADEVREFFENEMRR